MPTSRGANTSPRTARRPQQGVSAPQRVRIFLPLLRLKQSFQTAIGSNFVIRCSASDEASHRRDAVLARTAVVRQVTNLAVPLPSSCNIVQGMTVRHLCAVMITMYSRALSRTATTERTVQQHGAICGSLGSPPREVFCRLFVKRGFASMVGVTSFAIPCRRASPSDDFPSKLCAALVWSRSAHGRRPHHKCRFFALRALDCDERRVECDGKKI
jgi:hypothetical protein